MQATQSIFLVRPANFVYNKETALSNTFQNALTEELSIIQEKVNSEFNGFVQTLQASDVLVLVFEDTAHPVKPDAVFPNNWVSLHENGKVVLYPMCAKNRRTERRNEILEAIGEKFCISEVIDLSGYEKEGCFLEGTGSIVFDHQNKTAYACLSPRTDKELFLHVCLLLQYHPIYFYALDPEGKEIYHTNVMMCVADRFCVICLESITNDVERTMVIDSLTNSGHEIVDISYEQMKNFAGNMLELRTSHDKNVLAMSANAYNSLYAAQKDRLEKYVKLLPLQVQTIETIGGGSVRCMIAEIFLPDKNRKIINQ
ncbi:amidinotransferase [Flavisolibacter sp. BT320]|nr:amidinotransferase [Flavisolibacter longurius]